MKLISLQLKNFRQHKHSKIRFQDGMTAIVGANGSGKSTILEAITFALFGEQRQKKETIRFMWSEEGEKFAVELVFSFDGKTYRVYRDEKDAKFQDITGEVPIERANGLTAVTAESKRLLRLNYRQFINSFCAEQKKLNFLDFDQSAKLQEEVGRMLGYDRVGKAALKGKEEAREERIRAESIRTSLGDLTELKFAVEGGKKELAQFEKQAETNRAAHQVLVEREGAAGVRRVQAEAYVKLDSERREIANKAEGLKTAERLTKATLTQAEKDVAEYSLLFPPEAEFQKLASGLKELEAERQKEAERNVWRAQAQDLAKRITQAERELADLPAIDLPGLEKAIALALEALTKVSAEHQARESAWSAQRTAAQQAWLAEKGTVDAQAKALEKAERAAQAGECPECGQPITEGYRDELVERRTALTSALDRVASLEKGFRDLEKQPTDLQDLAKSIESARQAHTQAQTTFEKAKTDAGHQYAKAEALKSDQQALGKLNEKIGAEASKFDDAVYQSFLQRYKALEPQHVRFVQLSSAGERLAAAQADHESAARALAEAHATFKEMGERLALMGFESAVPAQEAIRDHDNLRVALATAAQQLQTDQTMLTGAKDRLANAEIRVREYEAKKGELETRQSAERHLNYTSQELAALRERLNRDIGPELEARASENLSALTDGRYPRLTLDTNFQPTITDGYLPKSVISGGEEDVLALSLRLALSELIQERNGMPLSLLILDEVFGGLDEDRRSNVLQRLMSLKGKFRQILVISHIEDINQVADQAIFVRRDPSGRHSVVSDLVEASDVALVELIEVSQEVGDSDGSGQFILSV